MKKLRSREYQEYNVFFMAWNQRCHRDSDGFALDDCPPDAASVLALCADWGAALLFAERDAELKREVILPHRLACAGCGVAPTRAISKAAARNG